MLSQYILTITIFLLTVAIGARLDGRSQVEYKFRKFQRSTVYDAILEEQKPPTIGAIDFAIDHSLNHHERAVLDMLLGELGSTNLIGGGHFDVDRSDRKDKK